MHRFISVSQVHSQNNENQMKNFYQDSITIKWVLEQNTVKENWWMNLERVAETSTRRQRIDSIIPGQRRSISWTIIMVVYVGNSGWLEKICKYPRQWTGHSEERKGGYGNKAYLRKTEHFCFFFFSWKKGEKVWYIFKEVRMLWQKSEEIVWILFTLWNR